MVSRSIKSLFALFTICVLVVPSLAYAGPEMVVRLDGQEVTSGGSAAFDTTPVGDTDQLVLTIRNEGDQDLFFTENPVIALGGGNTDQFVLIQPALEVGNKLSPNSSTAFAVRFEPTVPADNITADVTIVTNDPGSPFIYNFSASSPNPELQVSFNSEAINSESLLNFDPTPVDGSDQLVITLRNVGTADVVFLNTPPLTFSAANSDIFEIVQPALEVGNKLSPNSSTAFAVRYEPTAPTTSFDLATVTILTNVPDAPFVIDLNGFSFYDCNNNGVVDSDDIANETSIDCNLNTIPDECEVLADSDGDRAPDLCEACPNDAEKTEEGMCGCGVLDIDTDGDGTSDCSEECSEDSEKLFAGQCGCGVLDTDSDGDGTADCVDGCPNDSEKTAVGFCGCGVADEDLNENGVPDCEGEADFVSSLTLMLREIRRSAPSQDSENLLLSEVRALALLESLSNSVTALDESTTGLTKFVRNLNRLPRYIEGTFEGRIKRRRKMRRRAIRAIKRIRNLV